ncbi:hypothetical protein J4E86_011122 [Alternaria arbusti]|uniref:uncharacterized protein n=1 Tax=Alternaria arbusti TaxID=232088 RepID=UPI00221FCF35|nr:uncharacterized protein J4E86_011122 [Alternaria arbusti]KAI4940156.1 hypothetical protein J4E86_011122 [Alternaria arbusti]
MASHIASDEKAQPDTALANDTQSNSETEDLAMLALEKRVLKKTDMVVLPMSLSYASVYGLITDLNLRGNQFAWTSSIFYVGQLASEFPFIYLMSRFRLSKFVGITM